MDAHAEELLDAVRALRDELEVERQTSLALAGLADEQAEALCHCRRALRDLAAEVRRLRERLAWLGVPA